MTKEDPLYAAITDRPAQLAARRKVRADNKLKKLKGLNAAMAKPAKKRKKKANPETRLQNDKILPWLDKQDDIMAIRVNSGKFILKYGGVVYGAKAGTPDINFTLYAPCFGVGVTVVMEVKAPDEKPIPSPDQARVMDEYEAVGAYAFTANSLQMVKDHVNMLRERWA